ncbi:MULTISPECIES: hypothetical protein [Bacillaceae]|uniref:hypothetical protein n=1 Tax=Bacillaceae TaxID=186817 RepID=UPI001E2B2F64|nr:MULTISPECIES: hypothetical protein [Bacillaceae]MCE4048408.1 hypothetical protein [Bacillus sp. Au-Bac7]MCM3029081.1 hypothetical protein [Niallia sp. MER 6]MDL0435032.1 hypothetical protein [Niallia sp. SS-2023]UPO88837.1 hypothetical protein L8T27_006635 [Niallia sp. Man26]
MTLSYKTILQAIPDAKGYANEEINFLTVSFFSDEQQTKGLFAPLYGKESGDLSTAIANGAIGAIWDKEEEIPSYTPNHFPIFYTNDIKKGLYKMIELYEQNLNGQQQAKFIYAKDKSAKALETYDGAVIKNVLGAVKGGE